MPKIDHRVSQAFQGVMQSTGLLKPQQQALEFILPSKDALNGIESLLEDGLIEQSFRTWLWYLSPKKILINVQYHTPIENSLAIGTTIVHAIQTDDSPHQVYSGCSGRAHHL
ncbi:hypothetical protein ACSYAD_31915 [Acaryochloris marina NIES-2412]|uniref:hypothetical protein n=1 Tax=Acaryochloris marina TaxID=155978 RepID=UPI004058E689